MSEANPRESAAHALRQAGRAAKSGDLKAAQHWSRLADQLTAAAERLAALPAPADEDEENEEARRAELRRRLALFVKADTDIQAWEAERDAHLAACAAALANNGDPPAPLRPHPAGAQDADAYMTDILVGEEKEA